MDTLKEQIKEAREKYGSGWAIAILIFAILINLLLFGVQLGLVAYLISWLWNISLVSLGLPVIGFWNVISAFGIYFLFKFGSKLFKVS
jgi:hypothetical protein